MKRLPAVPLTAFLKLPADSDPSLAHLANLPARQPQRFAAWPKQRSGEREAVLDAL
jgi:hypothetical protein